jgi:hypothetical protein
MTKEEIISDQLGSIYHSKTSDELSQFHLCMDEFAKQQAVAFAVFRDLYHREERRKIKEEERRLGGMITWDYTPDGEIYNQFIESQNK